MNVPTNIAYTYEITKETIYALAQKYPFLNVKSIGKSVMGKDI